MVVMVNVFGVTRDQCHCCTVWDLMNETKDKKKKNINIKKTNPQFLLLEAKA